MGSIALGSETEVRPPRSMARLSLAVILASDGEIHETLSMPRVLENFCTMFFTVVRIAVDERVGASCAWQGSSAPDWASPRLKRGAGAER